MAGNSKRQGARRSEGSKKGSTAGSGGQRGKALRGKGPTPPAEVRTGHPAARRAASGARKAAASRGTRPASGSGARSGGSRGGVRDPIEIVAGRNSVLEALRANVPVQALYIAERVDADERIREILRLASGRLLPLLEAPRTEIDRLTGGGIHQGVALQVPPYVYAHPDDLLVRADAAGEPALIAALDGVTDPRNLGAVVRSVGAFGGHGVLVPERRSAGMTAGAWKASAGAAARIPVARATNLTRALQAYRQAGCVIVGLAADGATDVGDLEVGVDPLVLVVGSEGKGLSRLVSETCDLLVRIPMHSETESLNAGIAASIVLHAVAARRAEA
jgi:23S rRNA (guanosine2251-2'-O)-methyltransferase